MVGAKNMPNAYFFFFLRALGGPILTILRNLANKGSGVAIARSMTDSPDRAVRSAQWPSRTDGTILADPPGTPYPERPIGRKAGP